jgi:cation:H+ antiporter
LVFILLVIGFVLLLKGADLLVSGAAALANRCGISELIIGLTIISLGTSMPELIVNVMASLKGSSDMAIGNVLGSNIANLLLILGVTASIYPVPVNKYTVIAEIPFSIASILLIGFMANASLFPWETKIHGLSRYDGILILCFFLVFSAYILLMSKEEYVSHVVKRDRKLSPVTKNIIFIISGMLMLFLGGKWVVDGAIELSRFIGMSETFISLTVIAVGTSLPELVTSVLAAKRGSVDMAVGNVVGSNIFNALWILGLSSVIHPIPFNDIANTDLLIVVLASLIVLLLMILSRRMQIRRWHGIILLFCYAVYNVFIFIRG